MSIEILSSLSAKLSNAHRILETIVLQTNEGAVFTIEISQSVLPDAATPIGAKVTMVTSPQTHIGVCEGETIEQVTTAAQELVANLISSGTPAAAQTAIPKPHVSSTPKVQA